MVIMLVCLTGHKGSIPLRVARICRKISIISNATLAQGTRAAGFEPAGREFESLKWLQVLQYNVVNNLY
jgi:hypothetical protein